MINNNIDHLFLEGSRQLNSFYEQIMIRIKQLEEENRKLKEELRRKPIQIQQTLSVPLMLDLFEIHQENCLTDLLKNLSHKNEPELLVQFVKNILICKYDDLDKMDSYYRSALQAIVEINQPECREQIKTFLVDEFEKVSDFLLYSNHPEMIVDYMYALLQYDLDKELSTFNNQLLIKEWPFLDANVDKRRFYRFLWYGVLHGTDDQLVKESRESLIFLSNKRDPEIELYTLLHDLRDKNQPIANEHIKRIDNLLSAATSFRPLEKEAIVSKLQQEVKAGLLMAVTTVNTVSTLRPIVDEIIQIKKATKICPTCNNVQLRTEEVDINVYKRDVIKGTLAHEVLRCPKCQIVYMYGGEILKLMRKLETGKFKTRLDPIQYSISKKIVMKEISQPSSGGLSFSWPSTEARETASPGNSESSFKEESNLHRLGYRITGVTRTQRWDILVRKVLPQLPLKEIVYTIANNVKIRKRQVGGMKKFAYAITEWEHDLKRLKQECYKSTFTWPLY
jgi:hypothetical protein